MGENIIVVSKQRKEEEEEEEKQKGDDDNHIASLTHTRMNLPRSTASVNACRMVAILKAGLNLLGVKMCINKCPDFRLSISRWIHMDIQLILIFFTHARNSL